LLNGFAHLPKGFAILPGAAARLQNDPANGRRQFPAHPRPPPHPPPARPAGGRILFNKENKVTCQVKAALLIFMARGLLTLFVNKIKPKVKGTMS